MRGCWAVRIFFLLVVLVLVVACGCSTYNTPRRQRMRAYTVQTDLDRAVDDWDWIIGMDRPQVMYDSTSR
jgi:hypothetical protein